MKPGWVYTLGICTGFALTLIVAGALTEPVFPVRQRACWYAVDAAKGDTLAVLKRWPDCAQILLSDSTRGR